MCDTDQKTDVDGVCNADAWREKKSVLREREKKKAQLLPVEMV